MSRNLRIRGGVALLAALAIVGGGAGCSETVRTGRAPSYLIIENLRGISGADDSLIDNDLSSDVRTFGGVFEDNGEVRLRLAMKDVDYASTVQPTDNNAITLYRYRVNFRRTDGRNTPGVDVPWPFEGASTGTVTDRLTINFVLVRVQAKLESPLTQLAGASFNGVGGAGVISTVADVTFFGRDQVGNEVTVTGSLSVNFADWADPESE
jgi:hypothetical protein